MTQSIESMIDVLQAYQAGKKIEYRIVGTTHWSATDEPQWQFRGCEYRVAPEPKKKVKILAWFDTCTLRLSYLGEGSPVSGDWIRVPSEDKEVEI